ncbi:formate dehydrogenase subunit gamma [Falsigemmobacter faecalis]|uniref:Formate dehydrogenase subunit gamma n=1 Tax=Falsigemmobacter faecalis TaxID=2488730 RepID=A0A3P3DV94_9RHOB|nr:formate dehydrogenase subunit gamma [Falsigemmobacter faecalis]RRH78207.1 formate dehydrogenase subunit gamma [Falsigemmobacter faecalis]
MTLRFKLAALVLGATLGFSAPVMAQQPVNPTASSVQEQQLLDALKPGETISGRISIPDARAADLEKPSNKTWMGFNLGVSDRVMGVALVGTALALLVFFMVKGRLAIEAGRSGRTITRFNIFERTVHWTMATSFIVLALSGINVAVGRYIVMPWLGYEAFGSLTYLGKLAHNYLAWPFMLCVVITFVMWVRHNIPNRLDLRWLKEGGGLLVKGKHPPAKKFNAGQKIVFWGVVVGGGLVSASGLLLMFPWFLNSATDWQLAQIAHALIASGMMAMILGHIYIGTVGTEGALDAMTSGQVDVNWAEQHHSLWLEEELARGAVQRRGPGGEVTPAE